VKYGIIMLIIIIIIRRRGRRGRKEEEGRRREGRGSQTYANEAIISMLSNYTVFRKKTPTHIFFHISMIDE